MVKRKEIVKRDDGEEGRETRRRWRPREWFQWRIEEKREKGRKSSTMVKEWHTARRASTLGKTYHEQLLPFVSPYYFPQDRPTAREEYTQGSSCTAVYTCRDITRSLTSLGSKYDLASMFSRWRYLSGFSCFSLIIGSVCRRRERAAPNSRNSISSRTICGSRAGTDCDEKSQIPFQFSPRNCSPVFSLYYPSFSLYMQAGSWQCI